MIRPTTRTAHSLRNSGSVPSSPRTASPASAVKAPPRLWQDYHDAENHLLAHPTPQTAASYASTIRLLLQNALQGWTYNKYWGRSSQGRMKEWIWIQSINQEITTLLQHLQIMSGFELLRTTDHIRGLLLNLWC